MATEARTQATLASHKAGKTNKDQIGHRPAAHMDNSDFIPRTMASHWVWICGPIPIKHGARFECLYHSYLWLTGKNSSLNTPPSCVFLFTNSECPMRPLSSHCLSGILALNRPDRTEHGEKSLVLFSGDSRDLLCATCLPSCVYLRIDYSETKVGK